MHTFGALSLNLTSEEINLKIKVSGVVLVCAALSNSVSAADGLLGAQGMKIGTGYLYPELTLKTVHDDNITRSSVREVESFGLLVSPHLAYESKSHKKRFFIDSLLTSMTYEGSGVDDYLDYHFQTGFEYTPTRRTFAGIHGEYFKSHDDRGTGQTEGVGGLVTTPDKWHHYLVEGNGRYGTEKSKGRGELDLGYVSKEYDNHRFRTFVRDRDDTYANARFYYRIMPKTSLLLEGRFTDFSYDQNAVGVPTLDSDLYRVLAGVTWEGTFKTTGTATIGYIQKDFDSGLRSDDGAFTWEVGVEWRPKTFSIFTLNTSRDFLETNGFGDFIEEDSIDASWSHQWHKLSPRLSTLVDFRYAEDTYPGTATGREDEYLNVGVAVHYKMRRWLDISGGYQYDERDSTIDFLDYERNFFELTMTVTL